MGEPSTIGGMVSKVFAEATLQVEVAKDAHKALKKKLSCRAASDVDALERNPTSAARRAVIAEAVDHLSEVEKISVKTLATKLAETLRTSAAEGANGIEVRRVETERAKREVLNPNGSAVRKVLVRGLREA